MVMSYQKVLSLANKFAQDDQNEMFSRKYRALLSEMEGDYMSLRIKKLDRAILHEFGRLYHNLFEIFKSSPDISAAKSLLSRFVSQRSTEIQKLNEMIQHFLKENQVDFMPGTGFKQAEVHSLNKLFNLAKTTFPSNPIPTTELSTTKEEHRFSAGPSDKTNPAISALKPK